MAPRLRGALLLVLGLAAGPGCELTAPPAASSQAAPAPPRRLPQPTLPGAPDAIGQSRTPDQAVPRIRLFPGDESALGRGTGAASPPAARAAGDVVLDFVDVDVKEVVRAVLGDILNLPYAVDPGISGQITLQVTRPLARGDVLPALEAALKVNGAVIVRSAEIYSVVPLGEAQRRVGGLSGPDDPGYGVEVAPLANIAALEMQKLLEPFAPAGGILRVDAGRNLLFVVGTAQEREAMRTMIALFDVDWLRGMSYALVRPDHVQAGALATELRNVFDAEGSPIRGLVKIMPIARLNTLLIASPRRAMLADVAQWVERLDVPVAPVGEDLRYIRLENAKAADLAKTLGELYGQGIGREGQRATAGDGPSDGSLPGPPALDGMSLAQPEPSEPSFPDDQGAGAAAPGASGAPRERVRVVTDEANNALLVRAPPELFPAIEAVIHAMDVEPQQVLVDVTIVEVSLGGDLKYGVEWFFRNHNARVSQSRTSAIGAIFPGFNATYLVDNVRVAINALEEVTDVNVISSPKLLTLDNKPATLQVGDQVPVVSQSAVSVANPDAPLVNTVEFRDTGILLTVTPRIAKSGLVVLEVAQEVSDAVPTTTSGIDSPTIQRRRIQTIVGVHDGETVALGGLIKQSRTAGDSGIPGLKDVPVAGALFGTRSDVTRKTELLIFLSPRVIRSPAAARAATDELRRELQTLEPWVHQLLERRGAP